MHLLDGLSDPKVRMLFNSYDFLFVFLPISLVSFYAVPARFATFIIIIASLAFYGVWNAADLLVLGFSIAMNLLSATALMRVAPGRKVLRRMLLTFGVFANLLLLAYFKYSGLISDLLSNKALAGYSFASSWLPLGISFFTFTQIAFLVDVYRQIAIAVRPTMYVLFVSYFPHLIAGPIIHYRDVAPQFGSWKRSRYDRTTMMAGALMFAIGLAKKSLLADGIAQFASRIFDAQPLAGVPDPTFFQAWGAALCYTYQLYFDFSGYSDMAIGVSLLFGINLPLNFNSPYKSRSIIEFWRRWHITLSHFLRDYLFIPMGGSRRGKVRYFANLMITMLLGGLWHGAALTFIAWGGFHGLLLALNHAWRSARAGKHPNWLDRISYRLGVPITFGCVVVGWVLFRSPDFHVAKTLLAGMAGARGFVLPTNWLLFLLPLGKEQGQLAFTGDREVYWVLTLSIIVYFTPNTDQIVRWFRATHTHRVFSRWCSGEAASGIVSGLLFGLSVSRVSGSEFLYFHF